MKSQVTALRLGVDFRFDRQLRGSPQEVSWPNLASRQATTQTELKWFAQDSAFCTASYPRQRVTPQSAHENRNPSAVPTYRGTSEQLEREAHYLRWMKSVDNQPIEESKLNDGRPEAIVE
jgi:hypothetical protein